MKRAWLASAALVAGVMACTGDTSRREPLPPVALVDRIHVDKSDHLMKVYSKGREVWAFRISLGRGGLAPKQRQGDQRVPEGEYRITDRNPNSAYHLSLRIGYPTPLQLAAAQQLGTDPGNDIMIHGLPNGLGEIGERHRLSDWTDGCIAVTNAEMNWIWAAVPIGTPIEIVQ